MFRISLDKSPREMNSLYQPRPSLKQQHGILELAFFQVKKRTPLPCIRRKRNACNDTFVAPIVNPPDFAVVFPLFLLPGEIYIPCQPCSLPLRKIGKRPFVFRFPLSKLQLRSGTRDFNNWLLTLRN